MAELGKEEPLNPETPLLADPIVAAGFERMQGRTPAVQAAIVMLQCELAQVKPPPVATAPFPYIKPVASNLRGSNTLPIIFFPQSIGQSDFNQIHDLLEMGSIR